jgi:hypothetical protein
MRKRSEIGSKLQAVANPSTGMKTKITCGHCGLEQPSGEQLCLACSAALAPSSAAELSNEQVLQENLGKLTFDLKSKDIDVTLDQICKLAPASRRALADWVAQKSNDIPPPIRAIFDKMGVDEVFQHDGVVVADRRLPERMKAEAGFPIGQPSEVAIRHSSELAKSVTNVTRMNDVGSGGEEITYVFGKEMYRVADFCTFDVGPYSATTHVQPGETRFDAFTRLRHDLEAVAQADRIARRESYIRTMLGIKPAVQAASAARKE